VDGLNAALPAAVVTHRMSTASLGALALADPRVSLYPMAMMLLLLVAMVWVAFRA